MPDPYILTYRNGVLEEYSNADAWHAAYLLMQKRADEKWRSTLHAMNAASIGRYKQEKGNPT